MNLYLFDFDGTISKDDSMIAFLKHINKFGFYLKIPYAIYLFLIHKIGIITTNQFKLDFLQYYLQGFDQVVLEKEAVIFSQKYIQTLRSKAINYLTKINRSDNGVYIVSASLDIWMKPIAKALNMKLICTEANFENGIFVGFNENCKGVEKVKRIKQNINLNLFQNIFAFGDTKADIPMLSLANHSYMRKF